MWFSHHALITQQTVSAALRSAALAPAPWDDMSRGTALAAGAQAQQLALLLLQGTVLLSLWRRRPQGAPSRCLSDSEGITVRSVLMLTEHVPFRQVSRRVSNSARRTHTITMQCLYGHYPHVTHILLASGVHKLRQLT